ncbi:MAG: alanine/glycine:cation symporter family protein [Myxococcales bacterium]|nr:alanine:cation symporter family protein [Myxococcales bacterium]HIK84220.1 alanine:cation symporter family protein [Myxococcales bacterium]
MNIDETINEVFTPIAKAFSEFIFFSVSVGDADIQLIVLWLIAGAAFFTVYLRFINIRGFVHALRLVRGDFTDPNEPGEVSHFQALATAISGTVGVGNIAHVAVAISVGGPGAAFWMLVAGVLGMASKFAECTLGVKYRQENPDGSMSGGPMFYMDKGLRERNWPRLGKVMAVYYAACIIIGTLGIGSMFQSNQAYVQFVNVTGGEASFFAERGWLFGLIIALVVGVVIMGGIKSIARVASSVVPLMALIYISAGLFVIAVNADKVPTALMQILTGAFTPEGTTGGMLGVLILGFRRAAFSNEAGIGSSSIAHAAVRTREPVTEGFVALLEPFIDTIIVCSITALVITLTVYDPTTPFDGISGVELTSSAFESVIPWFPVPLAIVVILFAYSTMIAWSYYGLEGWIYLFGPKKSVKIGYNLIFCASVVVGCTTQLTAILDFSDAMIFAMALANMLALYLLAPVVRSELDSYWRRLASGEIRAHK